MDKKTLADARRKLLRLEIEAQGLSVVARLAGKPDRQINDMAAGRKAFGDSIAKELGPKIRPDLPRDWLIFPTLCNDYQTTQTKLTFGISEPSQPSATYAVINPLVAELVEIAEQLDDRGKIELIGMAKVLCSTYRTKSINAA